MKKLLRAFDEKDVSTVTDLLLHQDIDPNALIPDKGVSPFHLIIGNQSETFAFKITKIFLRCGGDPNVPSTDGVTPTHVAAAWGRTRILHLLLVNGGDPWIQDDDKKNAFNYAFEEQAWDAIDMLHHFQQVHSASKRDEVEPKFHIDLERVLLRKGEEMYAYVPDEKSTKSTTTQTSDFSEFSDFSQHSPLKEKINFFDNKIPENGWVKDFYQTACEVTVHCDPKENNNNHQNPVENGKKFITTVEIRPEPAKKPEIKDMRSKLFSELQEAVKKRKSKIISDISGVKPLETESNSIQEVWINTDEKSKSDLDLDLTDPEKTIDLVNNSSLAVTSAYFTCGEESDCKILEDGKIDEEVDPAVTVNMSNDSFVSVAEEYRYTDLEEGVVLVEKNLLVNPEISTINDEVDDSSDDASSILSTVSSVPSTVSYASDRLRNDLTNLGFNPGPILKTTKKLYLKKLWRLKKNKDRTKPQETKNCR